MNEESARQILLYVIGKTEWRWRQYSQHWEDIDRIFIEKGFEQQGFECYKFVGLLGERGIYSIRSLGEIITTIGTPHKYQRNYAGSITAPFYEKLRTGEGGDAGKLFLECINQFHSDRIGRPGRFYYMMLWRMLTSCNVLHVHYDSSYALYLKHKYCKFAGLDEITDEAFLGLSPDEWARFKKSVKPWIELPGIGENIFDYIVGDIVEASFSNNSFKLDSANEHFLRVTGISRLMPSAERTEVISLFAMLGLPYTLREINKGIYTYCSVTEASTFGYCRSQDNCLKCGAKPYCEKNFKLSA